MLVDTSGPHRGNDTRHLLTTAGPGRDGRAAEVLLDLSFGRDDITEVRHQVADRVAAAGLTGDGLHGFVLAVNEVITNVVLHAGGLGRLVLLVDGCTAYCAVSDTGPGLPDRFRAAPSVPATSEVGGRGIWLAYQLCDEVVMATDEFGTTIGLRIALSERAPASQLVNRAPADS
jgi:anti-sigma regulatory factor (Ser/Thr protein kinase)